VGEELGETLHPLETPINTGVPEEKVKSEEFFDVRYFYRFSFGFW
jgi:hypothetical protein